MTNYNGRLDEKIDDILEELHNSWLEDDYERDDPCGLNAKQAITSLIKELVAEAKPPVTSVNVIETYLQNGMAQKAAEHHGRNHAIDQFEQNLLKALEEV